MGDNPGPKGLSRGCMVPVLQTLRDGVLAGELDKLLLRVAGDRRFGNRKGKGRTVSTTQVG